MKYKYVGKIIATHGIKGEVKVSSQTDFKEERYQIDNTLYLEYNKQMLPIKINSYRTHKNFDLITFNEINNINDVLQYVNCDIYVDEASLKKLQENEFYFDDLINLEAFDQDANKIGVIIDIEELPHGDLLVLKKNDQKEALIPFVEEYIKEVNLKNHKIIINVVEGLL